MLTAVTRRRIFMVESTFANETEVYAMGVLIMTALTDPSVEATHCTNMLVHIPPSVHDRKDPRGVCKHGSITGNLLILVIT